MRSIRLCIVLFGVPCNSLLYYVLYDSKVDISGKVFDELNNVLLQWFFSGVVLSNFSEFLWVNELSNKFVAYGGDIGFSGVPPTDR